MRQAGPVGGHAVHGGDGPHGDHIFIGAFVAHDADGLHRQQDGEGLPGAVVELLFLQGEDADKDISFYINSPGGSVTAGLAIYDTMQYLKCDVTTYCVGQAASMGAVLLAAGTRGKRFALPNARIMIHQPWGGVQGQAADISIQAKEILRLRDNLNAILAHHTGKSLEAISHDTDRDFFMSAEEASAYGLVDQVVVSRKLGAPAPKEK